MDDFHFHSEKAYCENVSLETIANRVGTPAYVYSRHTLNAHLIRFKRAFSQHPTLTCFAIKANSNHTILSEIARAGFGGDLVSGGELMRALRAGMDPKTLVFSGVGKRREEITAALQAGILSFNVESEFELELISELAHDLGVKAPVSLRINPNIDAITNPKITTGLLSSKFGVSEAEGLALFQKYSQSEHIEFVGIACHIGSQLTDLAPLKEAADCMVAYAQKVEKAGCRLRYMNMGGGLGIRYSEERLPELEDYAAVLIEAAKKAQMQLIVEPGRVILGNAGVLLTKVLGVKKQEGGKTFVVVDAAMNDLLRPTLYDSYHEILACKQSNDVFESCDIVGPICETGDYFGKDRKLAKVGGGDCIFVRSCGAYASSMASNYNSRARAAEVLVDKEHFHIIRDREPLEALWQLEADIELKGWSDE
jgi:diaminopimelate decarboxylase